MALDDEGEEYSRAELEEDFERLAAAIHLLNLCYLEGMEIVAEYAASPEALLHPGDPTTVEETQNAAAWLGAIVAAKALVLAGKPIDTDVHQTVVATLKRGRKRMKRRKR